MGTYSICLNRSYDAAGTQELGMCLPLWQQLVRADCQEGPSLGAGPLNGGQPRCFDPSHRGPRALLFDSGQVALLIIIPHCHVFPHIKFPLASWVLLCSRHYGLASKSHWQTLSFFLPQLKNWKSTIFTRLPCNLGIAIKPTLGRWGCRAEGRG